MTQRQWHASWPHIWLVPPFPGAKVTQLALTGGNVTVDGSALAEALTSARVGGSFWGARPEVTGRTLVRVAGCATAALAPAASSEPDSVAWAKAPQAGSPSITGDIDVWHLFDRFEEIWSSVDDAFTTLAAIAGKRVRVFDQAGNSKSLSRSQAIADLARQVAHPFAPGPIAPGELIAILSSWRQMIDANKPIAAAFGLAGWKRVTTNALLWGGERAVRYVRSPRSVPSGARVAAWSSKLRRGICDDLDARGVSRIEIEDGFVRSRGLGADCVPPLSLTVDALGLHFDPGRPSALEMLLEHEEFDDAMRARAAALRIRLVRSGITKYSVASTSSVGVTRATRTLLVTGQVEDDASVRMGGGEVRGNLDLLRRVRAYDPAATIIYKPHPDVEAGHRAGAVPDCEALRVADRIDREQGVVALIAQADEVHVLTSLAGFEALLRERPVVTHGVPFYAGWGLTKDLGPVPARRTRRRSLDELVAATVIAYPRYLDPVTMLPCPVEVLLDRLERGEGVTGGLLTRIRQVQGRLRKRLHHG